MNDFSLLAALMVALTTFTTPALRATTMANALRFIFAATALVVALYSVPAHAQTDIMNFNEGPTDASNVFAEGPWAGSFAIHNEDGPSLLWINVELTKGTNNESDADAFRGELDWPVPVVAGFFGDTDTSVHGNHRGSHSYILQPGRPCQQATKTIGEPRSVVYDILEAGLQQFAVGISNYFTSCESGPMRMEAYQSTVEPTFGATIKALEPRPVPRQVHLDGPMPRCNAEVTTMVDSTQTDLVWFDYHWRDNKRQAFAIDTRTFDITTFWLKGLTNTYGDVIILGQGGELLYKARRDCDDPAIPGDGFCGNGPVVEVNELDGYEGIAYVWIGIFQNDVGEDPRDPIDNTCLRDATSAHETIETFWGMLVGQGHANLGMPQYLDGVVNVPVNSSVQLGCIELRAEGAVTVVDTVYAYHAGNLAERWVSVAPYEVATAMILPSGGYTITATPLVAGPYGNCDYRRDDLSVSSSVTVTSNEDGPTGSTEFAVST